MSDRREWAPRSALRWESGLALVVLIIGVVGVTVSAQFLTSTNLFNVGLSYGEIAISRSTLMARISRKPQMAWSQNGEMPRT